ncbi:MAG: putative ABC transporter permease [Coriobacteriaceae bacterium]|nr:putative ABC transporter permease [Coriobacteriaceae bacterium]
MARRGKAEEPASVLSEQDKALADFERALDAADAATGADRAKITQAAQLDAAEAVAMAGIAMESDDEAAEAKRLAVLAERSGNSEARKVARARARAARKKAKADHRAATRSARQAYDAIRYSDPTGLGFLLVIVIVLAWNVLFTTFTLTTYIKGSYSIDLSQALNLLNVMLDGVTIWLIWKRKKLTRVWVIAVSLFNILVGTAINVSTGVFNIEVQVTMSIFDIFMLAYFATSSRVKATLVEPFNNRSLGEDLDEEESFFRPKTWEFWRNLIIYFIIFSIVGHWVEAAVCLLIKYGIVPGVYDPTSQIWSDWLYPFPVYGIGFCVCAILLYPLKNFLERKTGKVGVSLAISFVANGLVCTLIEFSMGMVVNQDLQLWDYSTMFGNFMGQVCLQNGLFFAFLATLMTWVVYPALERLFRRIPNESMTVVFVGVVVGYAILMALYYINIPQTDYENAINTATGMVQDAAGGSSSSAAS